MDYKILLLDFDGVISPGRYFSEIYSEEYGIPIKDMLPFFETMKETANIGEADMKDILKDVIKKWKWEGTVDEFIEYWLYADSDIDERVKKKAEQFRKSGGAVYLATDQEQHRGEFIWNERGLKDWMDGKFISYELGVEKAHSEFFTKVIEELDTHPSQIIYFDDSTSKIKSASSIGINSILYKDFKDLSNVIN